MLLPSLNGLSMTISRICGIYGERFQHFRDMRNSCLDFCLFLGFSVNLITYRTIRFRCEKIKWCLVWAVPTRIWFPPFTPHRSCLDLRLIVYRNLKYHLMLFIVAWNRLFHSLNKSECQIIFVPLQCNYLLSIAISS